ANIRPTNGQTPTNIHHSANKRTDYNEPPTFGQQTDRLQRTSNKLPTNGQTTTNLQQIANKRTDFNEHPTNCQQNHRLQRILDIRPSKSWIASFS
ncbi:MAG: hypothetical protein WC554_01960, partial [Clostridia bacterium]